jgi:hypothetical protein
VGLKEWLWSLLPDTCEVKGCCRKGMRGNENLIYPWPERWPKLHIVMCDYCDSDYMRGEPMNVSDSETLPIILRGTGVIISLDENKRRRVRLEKE